MDFTISPILCAKSELRRNELYSWDEAAIESRCRRFLSESDWPWLDQDLQQSLTPAELIHATAGYSFADDNLCIRCQRLSLDDDIFQPNGASLVESASGGCQMCSLVLDSFTVTRPENLEVLLEHENPIVLRLGNSIPPTITARYQERITHNGESRFVIAPRPLAVITEDDPTFLRGKPGAIEFMGDRITHCLSSHDQCPKSLNQPLPLRLIDVGRPGYDEEDQPRLWINPQAAREPLHGVYVALSYCWGTAPFLNLTPDTYEVFQQQIPFDGLPGTLKDAIEITRGLGIRYLWVDALCIFQGPSAKARQDWAQQSTQMDTIFNQAAIVLGSAASWNAYDGIPHTPYHYVRLVEIPKTATSHRQFVAWQEKPPEDRSSPLHTRGWTFQERLLASRFVHLGKEKLFFECNQGRQYEHASHDEYQYQLCGRLEGNPSFAEWQKLVEEYSTRHLTHQTDSLIALSGVAKRFAQLASKPGEYLAGLWASNLGCDLLWCLESPVLKIDVAPSWSWASRRSDVSYKRVRLHTCGQQCAKIISTDITNYPGLYGARCTGRIGIKGPLRKLFLFGEQNRFHVIGFQTSASDTLPPGKTYRMGLCMMDSPDANMILSKVASRFQNNERANWECIYEAWSLELHPGRGLLLLPTGRAENEFERIGYFEYKEQRLPGDASHREELASNRDPIAHAAYLVDHPFLWMTAATDAGQDDLVEDWFGDKEAEVVLV